MLKVVRFLELMWLVIAIISVLIGTFHLIYTGMVDGLFFYVFAGLATLLFYVRKRQRKNIQKNTSEN
jgi:hypothetical protein